MDDKNQMDVFEKMTEAVGVAKISEQLEKLKPNPFVTFLNFLCILGLTYFYMFFIPATKDDPDFVFLAMYMIGVTGIAFSDTYRINKRIDLLVKLLKVKLGS